VNAAWLATVWLVGGTAAGLISRRLGGRRAVGAIAVLLLAGASLLTLRAGAGRSPLIDTGPYLSREAGGLLAAAAAALALCLLLAERVDGLEVVGVGAVGAAVVLVVSTTSPLLYGVAALLAVMALSLRWMASAPGPATLAAARVAGVGAASLIAASVFLPVSSQEVPTRAGPALVGGLLVTGVITLVALVPVGGWVAGAVARLRAVDIATWQFLIAPAMLITAALIPTSLPGSGRLAFRDTILVAGLLSAIWAGVQSLRPGVPSRYGRLAAGDLALVAAAIGTGQAVAVTGGLLLIVTHLVAGPVLLQPPAAGLETPRRLLWWAVSGLPPSPAFWGRLLILRACAGIGGPTLIPCVAACGLLALAAVLVVARGEGEGGAPTVPVRAVLAWGLCGLALAAGLMPLVAVHAVFGAAA
jgi:hypothetical protein